MSATVHDILNYMYCTVGIYSTVVCRHQNFGNWKKLSKWTLFFVAKPFFVHLRFVCGGEGFFKADLEMKEQQRLARMCQNGQEARK